MINPTAVVLITTIHFLFILIRIGLLLLPILSIPIYMHIPLLILLPIIVLLIRLLILIIALLLVLQFSWLLSLFLFCVEL